MENQLTYQKIFRAARAHGGAMLMKMAVLRKENALRWTVGGDP